MGNLKIGWLATGALAFAVVVVAVLVYARFRRDMRTAQARLESGGSQVIATDCGPIEYATFGEGDPVLVVHGIFGGFDQGLVIARGNVGEEFRSIVPSRSGYLRTPLPDDASPAGQADAYVCLLDALGIEQAAIMGTSAGGTSEITVPVLIINAVDDPLTLYKNAQSAAERIPGSRLVTIESGGHMLLGHEERIRSEVVAFLDEYS
jgi:pimeloyl-ACP methyl ester carboxylesterase